MEPNNKISTELSQNTVDPVLYFDSNSNFVLIYKKTEKLASALYMITGLFSDNEPMKWTLRKKVTDFLSFILAYKDTREAGIPDYIFVAKSHTLELVSLLEISYRGGLVSEMNFSILKKEFINLISLFDNANSSSKLSSSNMLSKTFFDFSGAHSNAVKIENIGDTNYKISNHPTSQEGMSLSSLKDREMNTEKDNQKKSNRQNTILSLLRKRKELTIKDIALVIKDCSEKTIQRELNSFITSGVLKRAGVRRWSRYSINQG